MNKNIFTLFSVLFIIFPKTSVAQDKVFEPIIFTSTEKQTSLLELYTSEGCSSCPPKDEWFGSLKHDKNLWKKYVPIAFHVDYWNYLGWTDKLSSAEYTKRQRDYSNKWQTSTIYTPGFVLNGQEWVWKNNIPDTSIKDAGVLKVEVKEDGKVIMNYIPVNKNIKDWTANIALLGSEITTDIKAGENNGSKLTHHFAVLKYQKVSFNSDKNKFNANSTISLPKNIDKNNYALAVWVSTRYGLTPVQATGGYLKTN